MSTWKLIQLNERAWIALISSLTLILCSNTLLLIVHRTGIAISLIDWKSGSINWYICEIVVSGIYGSVVSGDYKCVLTNHLCSIHPQDQILRHITLVHPFRPRGIRTFRIDRTKRHIQDQIISVESPESPVSDISFIHTYHLQQSLLHKISE